MILKNLIDKNIIAFIPVRGGSKGIPYKNIREICGKPLLYWTAKAASECRYINKLYIATDDEKIASVAKDFGFQNLFVIDRDPLTATDIASSESALLDFAKKVEFDYIVFIQATSPLLTSDDLNKGIEKYFNDSADSLFSAVLQDRLLWKNKTKCAMPINYDPLKRPRRQEMTEDSYQLVENGAFYITRKDLLVKTKCRISGNISVYLMPKETYFEIDEVNDFIIVGSLLKKRVEN
jgi:N-acylneuraminate cytidylyltransferase